MLNKIKIVSANANGGGGGGSNVIPNSINGELAPALPDGGEASCRIHTYIHTYRQTDIKIAFYKNKKFTISHMIACN